MRLAEYPYSALTLALFLATGSLSAAADEVIFDPDFLNLPSGTRDRGADLNSVLKIKNLPAGRYPVTLWLNNQDHGQITLNFKQKGDALVPCMPVSLLRDAGVKERVLVATGGVECVDIQTAIPEATLRFDSRKLELKVFIPQESLDLSAQGYIDPKKWDDGIQALMLNYNVSGARTVRHHHETNSANAYLDGGFNLYGFRVRSSGSWRQRGGWQRYNTFAERDLPGTLGSVQAGELFSGGDVLDSVPFRGVQAGSVVQMLPDSLQGYSPVIRGIANTQAKVEVAQHGYSLYTTWVPPGPFEIRDLNTASGNGDLEVTITEADGTVRRFTQPFATLGNLLRQNTWRYHFAAGNYHSSSHPFHPYFLQASGALGMAQDITLSTGMTLSDMYQTGVLGIGKSLGSFGALALDIAQAQTRYQQHQQSGQSYSLRYGKAFSSGTNLRFAGYRYATEGYRTFSEAVSERSYLSRHATAPESRRNRIEGTLTQNLGTYGSLYIAASQQTWWHSSRKTRQLQAGFNTMIGSLNLGIYASRTTQGGEYGNNGQTELSMMLSLPLGGASVNTTISRDSHHRYSEDIGLNGTAGDNNQLNYNLNVRRPSSRGSNDYAASVGYLSRLAQLNGGVSAGTGYHSANMSLSGSLLAHAGGIELSQRLGDTVALVNVERTQGVMLQNAPTSVTNERGYALVPYVRPYRANRIMLDTRNVDNDVDIEGRVQQIYPRKGAVVEVRYHASKNQRLLMQLTRPDGSYVPFGASVKDASGNELTLVGQAGQALVNLPEKTARMPVSVSWGGENDQQCHADVVVDGLAAADGISITTALCR